MNIKPNPQTGKFTFDEWMQLAKTNPEKFERERQKLIDAAIVQFPEAQQLKLKQLQFRIDGIRRKYKHNGLVCAQKLYFEMEQSYRDLTAAILQLAEKPERPTPTLTVVKD